MTVEIVRPPEQRRVSVLPWGMQIQMLLPVPQLVATGNRNIIAMNRGSHKRHVIKDAKAQTFRAHISAAAREALGNMKRNQPELDALAFPLCGAECPLRVDVVFCFCPEHSGALRLIRSDEDNLKKGVYDGIKGVLIDDDNWIVEGFWAKGHAPAAAREDAVLISLSRAGFRDWQMLEPLVRLPVIPPWRLEDHTRVLTPTPGKIILPH